MSDEQSSGHSRGDTDESLERRGSERPTRMSWRAVVGWLAPFVLAGLAFNVHAQLHIPRGHLPPPPPKKKSARAHKRPTAKPTPRTRPSGPSAKKRVTPLNTPRPQRTLDALWKRYGETNYSAEPTHARWEAAHRPLVHRLAANLRDDLFHKAPDPPRLKISSTTCKTIRCELVITGPDQHELMLYSEALRGLELEGEPLLRAFTGTYAAVDTQEPEGADDATEPELSIRFVLGFTSDLPDIEALGLRPASAYHDPLRDDTIGASG